MNPLPNETGELQTRAMALELDREALATRAEGDTRVPIALSSEAPVERWYGREILDHAASAVDLSYARSGLPFLLDHDTRTQIGILEDVRLGKGGKLRAMARAGNHPDAAWAFADIRDGVRPNISVGYRVLELKLEGSDERGDTYRATRWMPMEGSTVPVPADITVGVGRSASAPYNNRTGSIMTDNVSAGRDYDAERAQRTNELAAIAQLAGAGDKLVDAIQRGLTPAQFMRELQDAKIASIEHAPSSAVRLTERESDEYMLTRAIVAVHTGKRVGGFEREVSDQIAKATGRETSGFYMPLNMKVRASVTGQTAGTTSLGGAGVQTSVPRGRRVRDPLLGPLVQHDTTPRAARLPSPAAFEAQPYDTSTPCAMQAVA